MFTLFWVSTGIFLAGESKGMGGTIPSRQPRPGIAAKTGSWIQIFQLPESKGLWGFFPMTRQFLGIYQCGSPIPEVTFVGNGGCSGIPSWRIHIFFPRNVLEAFQAGEDEGKPLGMGQTPRSLTEQP